jgi:TatA/E family protein of Tat protein translocase
VAVLYLFSMLAFLKNISPIEITVILLVLVLLFGSKFLTGLGRATGSTVKEIKNIKKSVTEVIDDVNSPFPKEVS